MIGSFALLDLVSQAAAVKRFLKGLSAEQKLAWIGSHGNLTEFEFSFPLPPGSPDVYRFESRIGLGCGFFLDGDEIVFLGDHTTFVAPDDK